MDRTKLNSIIDALAFGAFVLVMATGVLLRYVLPPGAGHFSTLWGMDRHGWGGVHFWISAFFLFTLAIHFFLHRQWVAARIQGRARQGSGPRAALAVIGLVGLLGIAASPFLGRVERGGEPPHRMLRHDHPESEDYRIDGSMTLLEIEELTGVSPAKIISALELPSDLPLDEHLGRLRRRYGFRMHQVRDIVRKHRPM